MSELGAPSVRRYITQAKASEFRKDAVEWIPTGARSFNPRTLTFTDWYVVPDDDPRVDTVEFLQGDGDE